MPIYPYKCKGCGNTFDKYQKTFDEKVVCSKCESENVERLSVNSFDFVLKGTSWYKDGYTKK